jgi:short chain dehydrogenase
MTELGGTRALVTGATSGLGLAMARALVDAGARVAITSRDAERAGHIAADLGPGALGLALDARDEGAACRTRSRDGWASAAHPAPRPEGIACRDAGAPELAPRRAPGRCHGVPAARGAALLTCRNATNTSRSFAA